MNQAKNDANNNRIAQSMADYDQKYRTVAKAITRLFGEDGDQMIVNALSPKLDISETDNDVSVQLDLPGMKPEELDVQVQNNVLTVRGERFETTESNFRKYHRIERQIGMFSRSINLPCIVDDEKVKASYKNGVLSVSIPKCQEAREKRVSVEC